MGLAISGREVTDNTAGKRDLGGFLSLYQKGVWK